MIDWIFTRVDVEKLGYRIEDFMRNWLGVVGLLLACVFFGMWIYEVEKERVDSSIIVTPMALTDSSHCCHCRKDK